MRRLPIAPGLVCANLHWLLQSAVSKLLRCGQVAFQVLLRAKVRNLNWICASRFIVRQGCQERRKRIFRKLQIRIHHEKIVTLALLKSTVVVGSKSARLTVLDDAKPPRARMNCYTYPC